MIVINFFISPLYFMLQLAAAAPGLFMPLSFKLRVQIWVQLTMLRLLLKIDSYSVKYIMNVFFQQQHRHRMLHPHLHL